VSKLAATPLLVSHIRIAFGSMFLLHTFFIAVLVCSVECFSTMTMRSLPGIVQLRSAGLQVHAAKPESRRSDGRKPAGGFQTERGSFSTSNPKYTPKQRESSNRPEDSLRQSWKTGETLVRTQPNKARNSRRNDPWWMRDDESNNPAILPSYRPWWAIKYQPVEIGMKLNELRDIARGRGFSTEGSKNDLLQGLQQQEHLYSLLDSNFRAPEFSDTILSVSESCYPESYETAVE
jgi:hypothetical protein